MIFEGCQSKSKEITIEERTCPQCGSLIEIFSVDTEVACENCGFVVYNDKLNCAQWCRYARTCVGDEMLERMLKIAERNRQQREKDTATG